MRHKNKNYNFLSGRKISGVEREIVTIERKTGLPNKLKILPLGKVFKIKK